MSYKTEFQANNTDLQTIFNRISGFSSGTATATFTPTDSGGTTYKSKFADNNTDLRKFLEAIQRWPDAVRPLYVSDLEVGSSIYLNENGSSVEYLVVNQGIPSNSNLYDSSCNGTWLLRKDIYTTMAWDSTNNDYKNSDVHTYLNGTFLTLFDSGTQNAIKQVKIPYQNGTGSGGSVASGSSGLSTKIFLLSANEVSFEDAFCPLDGAYLTYFSGATSTSDTRRIAYLNLELGLSAPMNWWLRNPDTDSSTYTWCISAGGSTDIVAQTNTYGIRPALILPSDTEFDSKTRTIKTKTIKTP